MAKKRKRNWLEEREILQDVQSGVQKAEGNFAPGGNAKARIQEHNANKDKLQVQLAQKGAKSESFKNIIKTASSLPNVSQLRDTITASYNSLDATKQLAGHRASVEKALADAHKYQKKYGSDKNITTTINYLETFKKVIDNETKGGSAATNTVIDKQNALAKGDLQGARQVEAKGNALFNANMLKKYKDAQFSDLQKAEKNVNPKTNEKKWVEERKWQVGTPEELRQEYAGATEKLLKSQERSDYVDDRLKTLENNRNYKQTNIGLVPRQKPDTSNDDEIKALKKEKKQLSKDLKYYTGIKDRYYNDVRVPEEMEGRYSNYNLSQLVNAYVNDNLEDNQKEWIKNKIKSSNVSKEELASVYNAIQNEKEKLKSNTYGLDVDETDRQDEDLNKFREYTSLSRELALDLMDDEDRDQLIYGAELGNGKETKAIKNNLIAKYGKNIVEEAYKQADDYNKSIQNAMDVEEAYQEGKENPLTSLVSGVAKRFAGGVGTTAEELAKNGFFYSEERGEPTNWNTKAKQLSREGNAIQRGGTEAVKLYNKDLAELYQAASSMADMGLAAAASAPLALIPVVGPSLAKSGIAAIMSSEAAASAMQEAHDRGADDLSAFRYGIVTGINEALSERASLEVLLPEINSVTSVKQLGKQLAKSYVAEGSEEIVSDLLTTAYDNMVNKENSAYNIQIKDYMNQGMTKEQATRKADKEFLDQLHEEFTVGGLAGAMFGGAAGVTNYAGAKISDRKTSNEIGQIINADIEAGNLDQEDIEYMIDTGLQSDNQEIVKKSQKLEDKLQKGEVLSNREIGSLSKDLIIEGENTVEAETDADTDIIEQGVESNMPEEVVDVMLNKYKKLQPNVSPREYANDFRYFYALGKDSTIDSFKEAVDRVENAKQYAYDITPEAAATAYSMGARMVPIENVKKALSRKPSGIFAADFEPENENEMYIHDTLKNMAKFTGLDIIVSDDMTKYQELKDIPKNTQGVAITDAGRMVLNKETANILGVAMHEGMHFAKQLAPEAYKEYSKIVSDVLREDLGVKGFDDQIQNIQEEYKAAGKVISYDEALEEALAYATETLALNEDAMAKVVERLKSANITEAQKNNILNIIKEWIDRAIAAIKERISKASVRSGTEAVLKGEQKETTEALLKSFEAMRKNLETAEVSEEARGESKYSFAGTDSMSVAEQLELGDYLNNLPKERQLTIEDFVSTIANKYPSNPNIKTTALGITTEFVKKGKIDFRGTKLNADSRKAAEELATMAMALRDPRFETFRMFYTKGDEIVATDAITCYSVSFANTFKAKNKNDDMISNHKDRMNRLGADGYYMLHNHPSGDVSESNADLYVTSKFREELPGFKGHIIIDHNKFTLLKERGGVQHNIPIKSDIPDNKKRIIDHPLLYKNVNASNLGEVSKELVHNDKISTVIFANAKLFVNAIQEIDNRFIQSKDFANYINNRKTEYGSPMAFIVSNEKSTNSKNFNKIVKMLRSGVFEDIIEPEADEASYRFRENIKVRRKSDAKTYRVREDSKAVKFSLSEPVEETKDLIAVHNLTEEALRDNIMLGGFPMPSIAIIKASEGHEKYGPISVVFDKNTIDPQKNSANKVYSGDAWTPTFPSINFKIDRKVQEQVQDKIENLIGHDTLNALHGSLDYDNMSDYINRSNGDAIDAYKDKAYMKYAYVKDTGIDFEMPKKEQNYGNKHTKLVLNYLKKKGYNISEIAKESFSWAEESGLLEEIRQLLNDDFAKRFVKTNEERKLFKGGLYSKEDFGFGKYDQLIYSVNRMNEDLKKGGIPQVPDYSEAREQLDNLVDTEDKNYNEWLDKTFDSVIENKGIRNTKDIYTPSGNRRNWESLYDAVNLENVVKAMKADTQKGAGVLGLGSPTAAATYEFKSIDDIRSRKGQLETIPDEEYEKIKTGFVDRFSELAQRYIKESNKNDFGAKLDAGEALCEAIAKSKSLESLNRNMKADSQWFNYSEELAKDTWDLVTDIWDAPTGYFEAKPQRAVRLNEIAKVIIPDSASQKTKNYLNNSNIDYVEYKTGDEEDRKDKLNSLDNLKFSLAPTQDSEGRELSKQQQEYFANSKVRDRIGRLLEVYHGSPEGDFTVFLPGAFFTDDYFNADGYGAGEMVYAVYLNIEKPLEIDCKGAKWDNLDTPYGTSTQEIASNLDTSKYDGIIFRNINDSWIDDEEAGDSGYIYWTTNSNQIKSVTNTNPTTNEDIRYSLSQKEALDTIGRFKDIHEDIGRQLKILEGPKLSNQKVKSIAQSFKKQLGSKIDTVDLTNQLNTLFTMVENKKGNINNTDVMDKANQVVRDVMEQAKEVDPEVKRFINDMRKTKIYMTDRDKAEITDYNYFRKNAFGKLRLVNDKEGALPVDVFFANLENHHPEVYAQVVGNDNADAGHLIDLLDWIDAARYSGLSLYDMEGDSAVDHYTLELLNTYAAAKVEDITNNKAKQRELYRNIGEMVDFAKEQTNEVNRLRNQSQSEKNQYVRDLASKQNEINLKLEKAKQQLEDEYQRELDYIEEDYRIKAKNNRIKFTDEMKKVYAEAELRNKKWTENRQRTDLRQSIKKTRDRLRTTINSPKVKKHIAAGLQEPVKTLFDSIDLGEQYSISRLNKMRDNAMIKYSGEELKEKLARIDAQEYKFTTELSKFKDSLERFVKDAEDDSDTYYAPVINMINNTIDLVGNKSLMNMNSTELQSVYRTLRAIEKSTTERNRPQTLTLKDENGNPVETYEAAARLGVKQARKLGKLSNAVVSHMSGRNLMLAMGGFNPNSIMAQFANKFDNAYLVEAKAKQLLGNIINPVISEKAGKLNTKAELAQRYDKNNLVDVGFKDENGNPILLNHDSLIWEYLNLENDDNLNHAARGGITFPDYKSLYNRKSRTETYGKGIRTENVDVRMSAMQDQIDKAYDNEDYASIRGLAANKENILKARKRELQQIRQNIADNLTEYDKKVIDAWRNMLRVSTDMLNEYWNKTYGYEPFTVSNYWRIVTDPNFIKGSEGGNLVRAITNLSESGSTIARIEKAGNPIISGSAIFAIDDYINNTAKLIAYSGLQRDLNAVNKYKLPGYNNIASTVEKMMPKVAEHFYTLQQDLFGGRPQSDGTGNRVISTARGLLARSVLSPNLRVALAQVPSYLGTYRYTDAKSLLSSKLKKNRVSQDIIDKYTPLMNARGNSGFSLETSDLKADSNKLLRGLNKVDRAAHGWIYNIPLKMDAFTVRSTFGAYLDYARKMYPNLKEGTPEQIANGESPLYKKAAELFNEGTMRTQPMFNTLNRNAWQRSNNEFAKTATIYHTQPFQYFNLALQDIMEYKYENEQGNKTKAKQLKQRALKSIASILAANTMFVLMKQAVDKTIRHKKDELEAMDVIEQLFSSYANMFVFGSTIIDSLYSLLTRGYINDFEIYGTGAINSLYDLAEAAYKAANGKEVDIKKNVENVLGSLGIPASNIDKDFGGIYRNIEDLIDDQEWNYSNEQSTGRKLSEEAQVGYSYANGDISSKELNDYIDDIDVPEGADPVEYTKKEQNKVKAKVKTTVEDRYLSGDINKTEAEKLLTDSNLFYPNNNYQSESDYIEGIIAKWDIDSYKEAWIDTYGKSNGPAERAKMMQEVRKLPYELAFPTNPAIKPTYKSYKSSEQKLIEYVNKWVK